MITNLNDNDFLFRTVPSDAFQGVAMAQIAQEKGAKTVGVVYVNNDYGQGLAEAFSDAFEKAGGKVAASVAYEEKQASYRGELQRAAQGRPDTLVSSPIRGTEFRFFASRSREVSSPNSCSATA